MQILNECNLSIAWVAGKVNPPNYSATCIIKGTFRLLPGAKAELMEEQDSPMGDLFVDNDVEKSSIYESDFACYKPRTDLILAGNCHSPGGKPVQGCRASFQVGELKKSLYIFGNRRWKQSVTNFYAISEPDLFTQMPLLYENSFGGPEFSDNPHGKGIKKILSDTGEEYRPLPNIENPAHLITSPKDQPQPAGFGPRGRMWPSRTTNKMGTYDDRWLKERWPYFPTDFDWSYFNCAPPDMQLGRYLSGDETLYFENLHPDQSHFHARLPCLRVRLFVNLLTGDVYRFREVELKNDTLWVNPETEKLNLVWRGVIEVQNEKMEEIEHCLVVSEPLNSSPEQLEYYQQLLKRRLKEEQEEINRVEPAIEIVPFDDSWVQEMEEEFARLEDEFKKIEAQAAKSEKAANTILVEAGIDPAVLQQAQKSASVLSLKEALTRSAKLEQQIKETYPDLAKELPPSLTPEETDEFDKSFEFESFPEFDSFPEPLTRQNCEGIIQSTKIFENEDLADLDLTDLNFSGCNCRNTNFVGAKLSGAKFNGTILTEAQFAGCDLSNLDFEDATMADADLTGTTVISAILNSTLIDNADFSSAVLANASFKNSHGFRTIFVEADLKEAQFIGAQMQEADFETANLERADFTGANLTEASVEGVSGAGITMQSANITGLHASEGADFTNGNFMDVLANESIWEDATLDGANFSKAQLIRADFAGTSLKQTVFNGADLTMARFEKADLTETSMTSINLFQGSLEQARLFKTDIRGANCYEVEFFRTEIAGARFDGSNLKMTKLDGQGKW